MKYGCAQPAGSSCSFRLARTPTVRRDAYPIFAQEEVDADFPDAGLKNTTSCSESHTRLHWRRKKHTEEKPAVANNLLRTFNRIVLQRARRACCRRKKLAEESDCGKNSRELCGPQEVQNKKKGGWKKKYIYWPRSSYAKYSHSPIRKVRLVTS